MPIKCRWDSPVQEVEKWTGTNEDEIRAFLGDNLLRITWEQTLMIRGPGYIWQCPVGSYVIKTNKDEFASIREDDFLNNYEVLL